MYLLSIDPGMSTGIVLGRFEEDEPYERLNRWQIDGGLPAFKDWYWDHRQIADPEATMPFDITGGWVFEAQPHEWLEIPDDQIVVACEKFVPLPAPRSFKLDELEPIRIEGALEMECLPNVVWQRSGAMVLAGGKDQAARKRASDDVLRRLDLWSTGKKDIGKKDANDVNAAQKHALAYLRSIGHQPTLDALVGDSEPAVTGREDER